MAKKQKKVKEKLENNVVKKPEDKKTEVAKSPRKETDPWDIMLYPHMAEKSMALVDIQNKIVFVVNRKARKTEIKKAFEKLFDVKVLSVKTETTIDGKKKAFIKLHPDYS